jgi:hypothetical protein
LKAKTSVVRVLGMSVTNGHAETASGAVSVTFLALLLKTVPDTVFLPVRLFLHVNRSTSRWKLLAKVACAQRYMLWPRLVLPQDVVFFMLDQPHQIELDLYPKLRFDRCDKVSTTIDLFCGAGGLTAGFKLAGFRCLYGNDCNPSAIETFRLNHPETHADSREIEVVDPRSARQMLNVERGELTVLTGGPPCQGFQ